MLNGGNSYQGDVGEAKEKLNDAEALFARLKRQVKADYNSKGQANWRREAREDFDFEAGEQLNEEDKAILQDAKRPIVIFNRVGTTVDSVSDQEVQFLPRRLGVAKKMSYGGEVLPCDAEGEESNALAVWCGQQGLVGNRSER